MQHILTILAVPDVSRAVAFYTKAFGWPVKVEFPVYVELDARPGQGVGLYQREGFAMNVGDQLPLEAPEGAITATELYIRCDDLDEAIRRIEEAGARALSPRVRKDWGDEVAYFADPDGNIIALAQRVCQ